MTELPEFGEHMLTLVLQEFHYRPAHRRRISERNLDSTVTSGDAFVLSNG